jgi:hypothetical protein
MFILPFADTGKMVEIFGSDLCNGIALPASTLTINAGPGIGRSFYGTTPFSIVGGGMVSKPGSGLERLPLRCQDGGSTDGVE